MTLYTIQYVATLIGENLELLQEIAITSENIDDGEMVHVYDGIDEAVTVFTQRGIESLKEFLADVRTWEGGILQSLMDNQCDPDVIARVMDDEPKS